MITVEEENEFTVLIADLISTLSGTVKFTLKIWVQGTELPYEVNESCNYHFMQEGVRISVGRHIIWLFYDMITSMELDFYD